MSQVTPRRIAVIDIGKTNAKVVLIDATDRAQLAARSTPNHVRSDGPYPHADTERLWAFILSSLTEIGAEFGIDGISITTHGATGALLAGDRLALPVLDYEFDGPGELASEYAGVRPDFSESFSPALPGGLNWGAQLFWQAHRFPAQFAEVSAIVPYAQYWAWRLTGVLASEVTSLGCHTDLWSPDKADFSSLVDAMGWRHLFPPVRPAASVLGALLPDLAEITGLAAATPVTVGIHDSNASLLPHLGAQEPPFTIVSSGTWTIVMTVGGDTSGLDAGRDSLANVDAFGRPVPTARFMGGREFDLLVPEIATPSVAEVARVIADDIQVLPSFVPGVGPFSDQQGRWTVAPETLSAGERTAAVSLYLALLARAAMALCGLGRSITLEGPLARNTLFSSALSQLTGVPVRASGDSTGTSLGASLLFGGQAAHSALREPVPPLAVEGFEAYVSRWTERVGG